MNKKYDVAVVGAGIVGLAIARTAASQGKKVVVFERSPRSSGASIRNFGLVWPVGQAAGANLDRALRSRAVWVDLAEKAGISVAENGSLTLAYHDDEQAVLEEFAGGSIGQGYDCQLITPGEIARYSPATRQEGLKAGLWSRTECTVSPRQALPQLANYLENELGVDFHWSRAITHVEPGHVADFYDVWSAERVFICGGQDFETLYPKIFAESGITRCKLQMMRTAPQPDSWKLGPSLCAGLTLRHYDNFAQCPSLAAVGERYDQENPLFKQWGIHVLLSQNAAGELIIGDSHEYGWDVQPFDREEINREILQYLKGFAQFPNADIVESWHGIYPKISGKSELVQEVEPGIWIVNGLSGAGMTLSFGLADEIFTT
jgi:D-hydroxyproline dehydrogenase subunit beta